MPGFPLILAGCRIVFGDYVFPVRCVLAILGTIGCGCVYIVGRDLVNSTVGLWSCAAVSLSPPLVVFSPLLLTEATFATALVASLIPIMRLFRRSPPDPLPATARCVLSIACGCAIAIATYIRPTWLPAAGVVALGIIALAATQRARWIEAGLILASCGLLLAPWTYRNYVVCGHVVPTTLWVGPSLYDGLNLAATGDSDMTFFDQENLLATMSEYDMDREYRRRAWEFVRQHPRRTVELALIKAGRYWSPWPNAAQFDRIWLQLGLTATTLPLYGLAIVGLWQRRNDWLFWTVTLGPAAFFCVVHMLFVGSIRYRLPADAPLAIAAATGAFELWRRWFPASDGERMSPWAS
ncbi:MAG: hypothetical protein B7Z55_10515 [Planctomycetales bacterium 12-60-4]|nr:MAG: hypothetical protein B7Z55_10515 [Planctomycetales bacterium 12-60-4]